MKPSALYASLRKRLRSSVDHHDVVLAGLRDFRRLIVQGPWRPLLIGYYRSLRPNPPFAAADASLLAPLETDAVVRSLERDAYAPGFLVPQATVEAIVRHMREDDSRRIDDPHRGCAAVARLAHDPALVEIARRYLGAEPILLESRMYWTIPTPDDRGRVYHAADHGIFHYDVPDVKSLCVFVYLTDVDPESGPHVVIRGTHRRRTPAAILKRRLGDDEARRRYGDRILTITGPRGTAWFEDLLCWHKQAIGPKRRLLLSFVYSLHRRSFSAAVPPRRTPEVAATAG